MAKRIKIPFGENGDRTTVQDDTQADGLVSYSQGYTAQYSLDIQSDPTARRINRDRFNQIMYDSTSNIQEWQNQAFPAYVQPSDNGGTAVSYDKGMILKYSGTYRISLIANNTTAPDNVTNWADAFPLPLSLGGTGAETSSDARTNLGLGTSAVLDAGVAEATNVLRRSDGDGRYLQLTGGTISGDLDIDAGTSTTVNILSDDTGQSILNLHGEVQGTASVYLGQEITNGYSWRYNGDDNPDVVGEIDHFTLIQRQAGTETQILRTSIATGYTFYSYPLFMEAAQNPAGTSLTRRDWVEEQISNAITAGVAVAFVCFNGTGTVAIRNSFNVSSITDVGTGQYEVNFSSALSTTDYTVAASSSNEAGIVRGRENVTARTTLLYPVNTINAGGSNADPAYVSLAFYTN